jgi:Kef-type K+ transport system membrane component KefB
MSVSQFLISLIVILTSAKIGSEIAERAKLPSVLGELVAGIIVGAGIFAPLSSHVAVLRPFVINSNNSVLELLGQLGAILLLFEVGLDSDIEDLRRLGFLSIWLAIAGATCSFIFVSCTCRTCGLSVSVSAFIAAALTATSVGISVRTFQDLGIARFPEARLVLGGAVADDVLGLVILAVSTGIVATGHISLLSVVEVSSIAVLFLVGSLVIGTFLAPHILKYASLMRSRAPLATVALILCLFLSLLASTLGGLSPIIGAFAAGLVLSQTQHRLHLQQRLRPIASIFVPIFFVIVGAAMPISMLNPFTSVGRSTLGISAAVSLAAIVSKVVAGLLTPAKVNRLIVGCGMIPRGEVGLVFAAYGVRQHLLTNQLYSIILLVVMLTTFITPSLLKVLVATHSKEFLALE